LQEFSSGVRRSFEYLQKERAVIESVYEVVLEKEDFIIYRQDIDITAYLVSQRLKRFGYVMSAKQRQEVEKNSDAVIGGEFAIGKFKNLLFIAPFCNYRMDKKYKEKCRVARIPKHIRPFLYQKGFDIDFIKSLILQHTKMQS